MKYKILDCTLRDGGYYNLWKFSSAQIKEYLDKIHESKVDIVEIGFRFMPKSRLLGPLAYSSDDFLRTLNLPKGIDYSVMINASDLINFEGGIDEAVNFLFSKKSESTIDIVRIAIHAKDLSACEEIPRKLMELIICSTWLDSIFPRESAK